MVACLALGDVAGHAEPDDAETRSWAPQNVSSIARLLGVSRSTIYKYVPDLAIGDRPTLTEPAGRSELSSGR